METTLEPLPISISTLPKPENIPDPDIELPGLEEEEEFHPAEERPAKMTTPKYKAGLPGDFSGKNEDTTQWMMAMKCYFAINDHIYMNKKVATMVFLNKMNKGRGAIFTEGWYNKLARDDLPESAMSYKKILEAFEEAFIPWDVKDRARQSIHTLNMEMFNGDFDEYATVFCLAQGRSRVDDDSILVDALQRGASNQLAMMMTAATLPTRQEKTRWKWEQWLDKAGEFYRNITRVKRLQIGKGTLPVASGPCWALDPYAMDVDKVFLSPSEKAEHIWNKKCFICHKEGCHMSKHKGYPRKRGGPGPPQGRPTNQEGSWRRWPAIKEMDQEDPWVSNFMKQHDISLTQAIKMMGNYYNDSAKNKGKAEEVDLMTLDFRKEESISISTS